MGFLLPLLPALISAGGAIAASEISKSGSGKPAGGVPASTSITDTPDFKDWLAKLGTSSSSLGTAGGGLLDQYKTLFDIANPSLQGVQNYWSKILSADPASIAGVLAPEINQVNNQYDTARRSIEQFAPAGGERNFALAQSRYGQAGNIGSLIAGARPMAAQGLLGVGQVAGGLGLGAAGAGIGALGQSQAGTLGGLQALIQGRGVDTGRGYLDLANRQNQFNQSAGIGSAIFNLLKGAGGGGGGGLFGGLLGGGKDVAYGPGGVKYNPWDPGFDTSGWFGGGMGNV